MDHEKRLMLFDAVWAEQGSFIKAILWRLTGNRELFAEALQESLLQIWRHVEKLEGPACQAYVYRIMQSAVSAAWRRRISSGREVSEDTRVSADQPDERVSREELTVVVRRAISELPEQQGRALTMRYLEQKSYDAMAHEMDCSEATLRSHVSKALATLRGNVAFAQIGSRKD